jgi:hypothetical protein
VYGLQEEYSQDIAFVELNAADGDTGQAAFMELGLRGHPAIVIFDAQRQEVFRTFGLIEEKPIRQVLDGL